MNPIFVLQREISVAADEAVRAYKDKTPLDEQTATGVWDAMTTASENMVESIKKKDFTKYLQLANPKNGDDFLAEVSSQTCHRHFFTFVCTSRPSTYGFSDIVFLQINRHYSNISRPEMTLDKLSKIVPTAVDAKYKARWLRWWNSSPSLRASYRFLPPEFKEADLDPWLNKAAFWAGVRILENFFLTLPFYLVVT